MRLALALGLALAAFAQEQVHIPEEIRMTEWTIGCREEPAPRAPMSLRVAHAWVEENTLFADVTITNLSRSDIRLPSSNPGGHYWDAILYDSKRAPISYCGGMPALNFDPMTELITDDAIVTLAPGQTTILRRLALAPFWWYLRDAGYDAHSFEVVYTGWARVVVRGLEASAEKLALPLERAKARQCSLYGGELRSPRTVLPR